MPGFVFSYSGLEHANPAGHGLLRSRRIDSPDLVTLHGIVFRPAGRATALLHSTARALDDPECACRHGAPGLADYRVCFLLEEASPSASNCSRRPA